MLASIRQGQQHLKPVPEQESRLICLLSKDDLPWARGEDTIPVMSNHSGPGQTWWRHARPAVEMKVVCFWIVKETELMGFGPLA